MPNYLVVRAGEHTRAELIAGGWFGLGVRYIPGVANEQAAIDAAAATYGIGGLGGRYVAFPMSAAVVANVSDTRQLGASVVEP